MPTRPAKWTKLSRPRSTGGDGTTEPVTDIALPWTTGSEGVDTAGTIQASHAYADNGIYTVTVTVYDDDEGFDTETFTVTVNNVSPDLEALADQETTEGTFISLQAEADLGTPDFTDPGFDNSANSPGELDETFTATIDWGDGTTEPVTDISLPWTTGSEGVDTAGTIQASHAYADNGIYTVTVTVYDDDEGFDTETFTVTVNNVSPDLEAPGRPGDDRRHPRLAPGPGRSGNTGLHRPGLR